MDSCRNEIQILDAIDDTLGLEAVEAERRKLATANLFKGLQLKNSLWAQKAKIRWIKEGDVNLSFFHRVVNHRRKGNEISGFQFGDTWVDNVDEVKKGVKEAFQSHFRNPGGPKPTLPYGFIQKQISEEVNLMLCAPFSEGKVKQAIWSCEGDKSPGPDGFNFSFFKDYWEIVKSDVMRFLMEFHRNGKLVRGINASHIVLIPKKPDPLSLSDFRPISLIGSIYKILAKLLPERLSKVLDSIISEY